MPITAGSTTTAAANVFFEWLFNEKCVFPPELLGKHKTCFDYILNYLEQRNVIYKKTKKIV